MANDFINVNRTKQHGNNTVRAADLLRELRELIDKIGDGADHMHDGVTYTAVESNFGLSSGAGANFVTLITLLRNILNTNTTIAGVDRLAQLDEFCARLAGQ